MGWYPAVEAHGLIGDLQTCALVSDDGNIDWFCAPRFDSPSIFASLLDQEKGGTFHVRPDTDTYVTKQLYLPGTAILVTRFMTPDGVGELTDFMPIAGAQETDRHLLIRLLRVVRGQMSFIVECEPRFDYGRQKHQTQADQDAAIFRADGFHASLSAIRPPGAPIIADSAITETGGIRATFQAEVGWSAGMVFEVNPDGPPRVWSPDEAEKLLETTRDYWRGWVGRSTYRGRWREMVERSAITLKLMTYAPSGALVAAPTAGLPELVGGERNWDYRFTWVRDASFSVHALLGLGFQEEADAYMRWLAARTHDSHETGRPLQIMYRIDGSPDLEEMTLNHFEGYRGSSPARIGNGAATQLQLDVYGEAMDSIYLADLHGLPVGHQGWLHIRDIITWLCDNWDQPDAGLWETRGGDKNFTYGRLMTWVAFDRAIRVAEHRSLPGDLVRWGKARDAVYNQIMERGWNPDRGAFVQHYDSDVLDASLLYMPLVGFIAPSDPMWQSTLAAMDKELVSDSLVYRYNPEASPDGLRGSEGTFSMCTFWYVEALARSGRLEDARLTFEKMLTYANPLGLYAEEIGPSGEQLGNFPQAFSHLALIKAAVDLDRMLDEAVTPAA
ncbi:glycoside hydrolase family 15 protein [Nonomuraea sp. NPDC050536]|uniref:glycoside hydrolase family 15 protein n=1 Tax=Nonomuraea sp. NPDC050536 TaxID=3364366 RepID=UPI0037C7F78B